MVALFLL